MRQGVVGVVLLVSEVAGTQQLGDVCTVLELQWGLLLSPSPADTPMNRSDNPGTMLKHLWRSVCMQSHDARLGANCLLLAYIGLVCATVQQYIPGYALEFNQDVQRLSD